MNFEGGDRVRLDPGLAPFMPRDDRAAAVENAVAERTRRMSERVAASDTLAAGALLAVSVEDVEVCAGQVDAGDDSRAMVSRLDVGAASPGVRMRIYRPLDAPIRHAVLYLHGGAFVFGDITDSARQCAEISSTTHSLVAMLDYRLAPENPYPAALADSALALLWLARSGVAGEGHRVAVVGSSAGGNLTAALAQLARDSHLDLISFQGLLSPVLDPALDSASMVAFGSTPGWNADACRVMWRQYLGGRALREAPYAAPGVADDLSHLPPAFIVTAECDPLRDEGIAYAQRLLAAGGRVELHHIPGAFHGFLAAAPDAETSRGVMRLLTRALSRAQREPTVAD